MSCLAVAVNSWKSQQGSQMLLRYSSFYMDSSGKILAQPIADITSVTISICGCDYCRETGHFIFSLRMEGKDGNEYASVGTLDDANTAELLRTLLNIKGGNLTFWDTSALSCVPRYVIAL